MTNDKPRFDPMTEAAFAKRLGLAILSVLQHKGVVTDLDVETILAVAQQALRDGAEKDSAGKDSAAPNEAARAERPQTPQDAAPRDDMAPDNAPTEHVPHIDMEL